MPELTSPASDLVCDPGIPTLKHAIDPVALRDSLASITSSAWGKIQNVRLHVLKHHPGLRCTFAIALGTTKGNYSVIGKVYATDRPDVPEAMERIWRAGFDSDQEYSIPRPLAYVSELRLLLQEKVEGVRAKEVFLKGDECERVATAERCARWLARFHTTAPKAGPVLTPPNHLASLERWSRHIADADGGVGEKAARLFTQLEALSSELSATPTCAGHGSYNHAQILVSGGVRLNGLRNQTIALDWDGYDVADPGRDVARFTVHLRRLALSQLGSIRALDCCGEVFRQTYVAACGSERLANLEFYQAAVCLQFSDSLVRRPNRELGKIEAVIDEGLRILDQGAN